MPTPLDPTETWRIEPDHKRLSSLLDIHADCPAEARTIAATLDVYAARRALVAALDLLGEARPETLATLTQGAALRARAAL